LPDDSQLDLFAPADAAAEASDLLRVEASIEWLKLEAAVRRLPRAATLAPVPGLPRHDGDLPDASPHDGEECERPDDDWMADEVAERHFIDERHFVDRRRLEEAPRRPSRQRSRSLRGEPMAPLRVPEQRSWLGSLSKLALASAIAAPIAYLLVEGNWPSAASVTSTVAATPRMAASLAEIFVAKTTVLKDETTLAKDEVVKDEVVKDETSVLAAETSPIAETPSVKDDGPTAAPVAPASPTTALAVAAAPERPREAEAPTVVAALHTPPEAEALPAARIERAAPADRSERAAPADRPAALPEEEVTALVTRGQSFFEAGDVAAARLLFRRAANAGNAAAALAMGATYDPSVLSGHFVHGINSNVDQARTWYERARALGSPEGPRRIEMLANR
jgi:hypothetical protein